MICSQCNKEFTKTHHSQKYCSKECSKKIKKEYSKEYSKDYFQLGEKEYQKKYRALYPEKFKEYGKKLAKKQKEARRSVFVICPNCSKEFNRTSSNKYYCSKECTKTKIIETQKRYHQSDSYKEVIKKYYQSSGKKYQQSELGKKARERRQQTESYKGSRKKYQQSEKGKKALKKYQQSAKGIETTKVNTANRKKIDPIFKLTIAMRHRLNKFLKVTNMKKTNSTFKIIGCTPKFLKEYLEKKFKPGMTWENHTKDGWHVDHRLPLSSGKTLEDTYKLAHYTNLQPMWATENLKKGNKII